MKNILMLTIPIILLASGCTPLETEVSKREADTEYYCKESEDVSGEQKTYFLVDDICEYKEFTKGDITYNCPNGYHVNGYMCQRGSFDDRCRNNQTYDNGSCFDLVKPELTYSCSNGTLDGVNCYTKVRRAADTRYKCEEDETLKDGYCYK